MESLENQNCLLIIRCLSKFSLVPGDPGTTAVTFLGLGTKKVGSEVVVGQVSIATYLPRMNKQKISRLATRSYCSLVLQHIGTVVKGRGWFVISVDTFEEENDLNTVKHVQEHVSIGISLHIVQYW